MDRVRLYVTCTDIWQGSIVTSQGGNSANPANTPLTTLCYRPAAYLMPFTVYLHRYSHYFRSVIFILVVFISLEIAFQPTDLFAFYIRSDVTAKLSHSGLRSHSKEDDETYGNSKVAYFDSLRTVKGFLYEQKVVELCDVASQFLS